jgi:signal transduction histidine kinase
MIAEDLSEPLNVLLVEDNEHDRIAFSRAVGKERHPFHLEAKDRAEEALDRLSAGSSGVDVVVVDYDLPGLTGLEMFEELKQRIGELRLPPFLMLTGAGTEDLAVRAIKTGIYDYLVKDPEDRYLKLIPTMIISVFRRHEQRLAYLEAQQQLARAHRKLEKTVEERTRDLMHTVRSLQDEVSVRVKTEQALRQSRKRLHKLSLKAIESQENDRKAIARELHDSIGGSLAAIKMSLETRIEHMGDPPSEEVLSLESIVGYLKDVIGDLRRISARLRPQDLDSIGLGGAIRTSCRRMEDQFREMRIDFRFDIEEDEIPDSLKLVVYRIAQEALTNAGKHASAEKVAVAIGKEEGSLLLSVEDDGCGFDQKGLDRPQEAAGGFGMKSMRDRAELNGGSLQVRSAPGVGTRITARLPLVDPQAE